MTATVTCPRCNGTPTGIGCLRCANLGVITPGQRMYGDQPLVDETPAADQTSTPGTEWGIADDTYCIDILPSEAQARIEACACRDMGDIRAEYRKGR